MKKLTFKPSLFIIIGTPVLIVIYVLIMALLVAVFSSCATDKHELDGTIIKVRDEYYKMENRMGNSYVLEPIKIDSTVVILNDN